MSIRFDSEARIFVLETAHTSYHMKVDALGHLLHLYYGKTIGTGDLMQLYPRTDRGFSPDYYAYRTHRGISPDLLPQEYTGCNVGDFRLSCLTVADSRGTYGADFTYVSHTVEAGKYQLTGLPCAHAEENDAETLIVRMQDEATGTACLHSRMSSPVRRGWQTTEITRCGWTRRHLPVWICPLADGICCISTADTLWNGSWSGKLWAPISRPFLRCGAAPATTIIPS